MVTEIRCTACGERCNDTESYCPHCHASISRQQNVYDYPLEGIEVENWKKFLGKNSDVYIRIFRKNEGKKIFASFNPWAFFFHCYWMFYRKMYGRGMLTVIAYFICITLSSLLIKIHPALMLLMIPVAFGFLFCVGLFANAMYKDHAVKKLSKPYPNMQNGGTSMSAVFIGWIAVNITSYFLIFLIGSLL